LHARLDVLLAMKIQVAAFWVEIL